MGTHLRAQGNTETTKNHTRESKKEVERGKNKRAGREMGKGGGVRQRANQAKPNGEGDRG